MLGAFLGDPGTGRPAAVHGREKKRQRRETKKKRRRRKGEEEKTKKYINCMRAIHSHSCSIRIKGSGKIKPVHIRR
jgi:hypothetical protein